MDSIPWINLTFFLMQIELSVPDTPAFVLLHRENTRTEWKKTLKQWPTYIQYWTKVPKLKFFFGATDATNVSSGIQSQSRQPYLHLVEAYINQHLPRITSGATPGDLLMTSWLPGHLPTWLSILICYIVFMLKNLFTWVRYVIRCMYGYF